MVHIKQSRSVFTRHSSNIVFQTIFCIFQHVVLVGGFAASDWLFFKVHELLTPLGLNIARPDNHVWVFFQDQNDTAIQWNFFRSKAVSDGAISFYLHHIVRTRVSKFTYGTFCHIPYDPNNPDHQSLSHNVYTDDSGEIVISGFFDIILSKVSCLFPFSKRILLKNLFKEHPSFGDEGIQRILFHIFKMCSWSKFPSWLYFCLVLPWKRRDSKVDRRWYQWESSHNHLFSLIFCR